MYFVKKIAIDNDIYQSSDIVDYTNQKISAARILLEKAARNFIKDEMGRSAADQAKIMDIYKLDQVSEPIVDSILLYRLIDHPHCIHLYQRKTSVINQSGWIYGSSDIPKTEFKRTHIFELEETNFKFSSGQVDSIDIEMIPVGPGNFKIPKQMTVAPMRDLIGELKNSPRFKSRSEIYK